MSEAEQFRPFYDRRWFRGTAAVLGIVGVVFGLVGPPNLWDVVAGLFSDDPAAGHTEIVLDASAGMGVPFGSEEGETKLSAAARAVDSYLVPYKEEGFALRSFGGSCTEPGRLIVGFGTGHNDDVSAAADDVEAAGDSNLARAVIAAIDDFGNAERFPPGDGAEKRIVVFTGTVDTCDGENAPELIRRRMEPGDVALDFTFVGVAIPEDERDLLRRIAGEAGEGTRAIFADTNDELAAVVAFVHVDGLLTDGDAVLERFTAFDEAVYGAVEAVNAASGRSPVAERRLARAERLLEQVERAFKRLASPREGENAAGYVSAFEAGVEIHRRQLETARQLVELRRDALDGEDDLEYENAIAEWEGLDRQHADNAEELARRGNDLAESAPDVEG